jgi:hypothetical protein
MPIRQSLAKEVKEAGFVHRMLADAIKAQRKKVEEAIDFGDNEVALRVEHAYLAWLEKHKRHEGEIQLALK